METASFRSRLQEWLVERRDDLARFRRLPAEVDAQFAALRELQQILYDAGWLRYGWPVAVGGLGGSAVLRGILPEELAAAGIPPPVSFGMMEVLGPAVVRFAPELAAWALSPLLSGAETWCQGFSEPDAGSDLASLRLRAADDGDRWRLEGQKVWTSWAQHADRCLVLARTGRPEDAHRGISALFVDMDTPGITVRPLRAMSGEAEFAELFFDDVVVPKGRTVGAVGGGWAVAMYVLSWERGSVAWQRQAWMHRRLDDVVALTRTADPGRNDGRAAAWAGETTALLYALRLASRRTLRLLAAGELPGPDASVDKLLLAAAEQCLFDGLPDLAPAILVAGDGPGADVWRSEYLYSRAASIYGGTAEIQRNIVAERVLGLPRSQ